MNITFDSDHEMTFTRIVVLSSCKVTVWIVSIPLKGIFRDHSRDTALNFHKIRDVCILVMVLDE